ncbi:hypothetical protein BJY52DRAFT_1227275 [Lactarius psammicola]|nr:hypothetical protein BJY52DRAFT_1227275 [Lactarius psammicola]
MFKKGKGEKSDEGKLMITGGYWWVIGGYIIISFWQGRNATISGDLTLGYATSKSDNEHGERCEWVTCVVLFGEWNKCVLDASTRWGMLTRVRKDWGTSLQTAPREQLPTWARNTGNVNVDSDAMLMFGSMLDARKGQWVAERLDVLDGKRILARG